MNNITPVVKQLLIINIIFYIGSQIVPTTYDLFSLYYFEHPNFRIWQPLTSMFMHAQIFEKMGIMHIAFNMMGLVMFGSALEHFWGGKKFLFFYIACGLGAALVHTGVTYYEVHQAVNSLQTINVSSVQINEMLLQGQYNTEWLQVISEKNMIDAYASFNTTAVGASGALYGLLVAFAFMFPEVELLFMFIPMPIKAKIFVPILVLLDLFSGTTGFSIFGGGIAHFAHVGGALFGFMLMWYWRNEKFKHNRWN